MVPDTERRWIQEELRSTPHCPSRATLFVLLAVLVLILAAVSTC
jgi:hypothetical protein